MQKLSNLVFIIILVAISMILPLNTEVMNIDISAPIITTEPLPEKIEYAFEPPLSQYNGNMGFGKNPLSQIELQFSSSNGTFEEDFLNHFNLSVTIQQDAKKKKEIKISDLNYTVENGVAKVRLDYDTLSSGLGEGYYNIVLSYDDKHYEWNLSTIHYDKKLTKSLPMSELKHYETPRVFYLMDKQEKQLVPIYRIKKTALDWIKLYNELKTGANPDFMLKEPPTMARSYSYWIEAGKARIDYMSSELAPFKNQDLLFESIAETFISAGNLTKTTINVDGQFKKEIPATKNKLYYTFTNESDYMFIVHEPFQSSGDFNQDVKTMYQTLREKNVAPLGVEILASSLEDGKARIIMTEEYQTILAEHPDYQQAFEHCFALSLWTLDGVTSLEINGQQIPPLAAINLDF